MLPSGRSNPKRRRLESSESGESASVGYAHPYSEGWPHYARPTAPMAVPTPRDIENSFFSPSAALTSFPLLSGIPARLDHISHWSNVTPSSYLRVSLDSSFRFSGKAGAQDFSGTIVQGTTKNNTHDWTVLTDALLEESGIELSVICSKDPYHPSPAARNKAFKQFEKALNCTMSITIYGPLELFEEIGSFFQEHDVYLQDPLHCDRHARYCNPHRLSSTDLEKCIWTSDLGKPTTQLVELTSTVPNPELLDAITSAQDLPEADQPRAIRTSLARHQRQALTFMQRREEGWAFNGEHPDVWEYVEHRVGDGSFVNRISDSHQKEQPENFQGGIIADPMGLGKTLTMIALAASDLIWVSHAPQENKEFTSVGQTLVIVPPPLLGTWEEQLTELITTNDAHQPTIVLTTYHTVSAEWKNAGEYARSGIFSRRWRRIILDEAHIIRNHNSQMAHAICSLDGDSRWAVTGTPIQNKLSDLATLLKFLRIYPYSDKRCFDADFTNLWKNGQANEALKRLKRLAGCLILRRPSTTIQLPERRDLQCPLEFSPAERELYQDIRTRAIERLDEFLYADNADTVRPPSYVNVLQQIEEMRMVCNLGLCYRSRHDFAAQDPSADTAWNSAIAQRAVNLQLEMNPVRCKDCKASLDAAFILLGNTPEAQGLRGGAPPICDHTPVCPFAPVSFSAITAKEAPEPAATVLEGGNLMSPNEMPSKVKSLILQLKNLPHDTKRLTLTVASYAFLMEPHWNPTLEDQALARIHRMGQTREVTTVRFYIRDSFEERVMEVQEKKRKLATVLLAPHGQGEGEEEDVGSLQRSMFRDVVYSANRPGR
ncbi:SNF2 family N-terminal domain-containing protein [Neurospora hispaniola]|uniref:SNF2 family N-terminal domain-containing protein n=1 Tax=Neurospora hispaniola TaxID=588809 RepID=A0AAJ0MUA9_9PEZI|nr:SNF2 family N-terminal domain-containing protein [Neurospora hispaniola]